MEAVENLTNKPMHNPPYVMGVISAPDGHHKPVLYSHYQATKDFNAINQDIYRSAGKYKSLDRKKTPKPVLFIIGAGALFGAWKFIRHLIKK